jgi:hypothetical protein
LSRPAERRHRGRVPDAAEQRGLDEGGQPGHARVDILDLDERHAGRRDHALGQRADLEREETAMVDEDCVPALAIERHAVRGADFLGLVDVGAADRVREVAEQEGLEPEEDELLGEGIGPRLDIGGDCPRLGRILAEMALLVAVGGQDEIGHDRELLTGFSAPGSPAGWVRDRPSD